MRWVTHENEKSNNSKQSDFSFSVPADGLHISTHNHVAGIGGRDKHSG